MDDEETDGFTVLSRSVEDDPNETKGSIPAESVLCDYAEGTGTNNPRLRAKVERLEAENRLLVDRLAALEALVFRGVGESSAFLHRLGHRVGEVDRWILQHERARNHLIRRHVPCGFVPDHSSGNAPVMADIGTFGLLAPLFQDL